jgi:hypothetical protein
MIEYEPYLPYIVNLTDEEVEWYFEMRRMIKSWLME